MRQYLRIDTDGSTDEINITGSDEEELKYIRIALGCEHLEGVGCGHNVACYIDEDGKARGRLPNRLATEVVRLLVGAVGRRMMSGDFIAGPALFFASDKDGNAIALPADVREIIAQLAPRYRVFTPGPLNLTKRTADAKAR